MATRGSRRSPCTRLESLPIGDAAEAVAWTVRAADRAMTQLAWEEAASLYRRALDAGDAHGLTAPPDRCRLLLALAQAQVRAFDLDDARRSLLAAVDMARAAEDVGSLARAALTMEGINDAAWEPIARALCAEVLDQLPDVDSAVRARLLALLVVAGGWQVPEESGPRSTEALAMAERVGDPRALREALRARQMALSGPDGAAERLASATGSSRSGATATTTPCCGGGCGASTRSRSSATWTRPRPRSNGSTPSRPGCVPRWRRWHVARCRAAVQCGPRPVPAGAGVRPGGGAGSRSRREPGCARAVPGAAVHAAQPGR